LCSQVACPYGRRGRRIRLSGEARAGTQAACKRRGRAFEYFGSLDRWARSIRSSAVLVGFLFTSEGLGLYARSLTARRTHLSFSRYRSRVSATLCLSATIVLPADPSPARYWQGTLHEGVSPRLQRQPDVGRGGAREDLPDLVRSHRVKLTEVRERQSG
jgi:hypothetical protein